MKKLNTILTVLVILFFQHVILINSVEQDESSQFSDDYTHSWPQFYHLGESTHPTQTILNNLTYYQNEWNKLQNDILNGFGTTYTFTMAWDCASGCDKCFESNKFINVENDIITSLTTSELNDISKKLACSNSNSSNDPSQYRTIDQLYESVIKFVRDGLNASDNEKKDYMIIELMLHKFYYFPVAVKLELAETYYAWDIECFEPGINTNENDVCDYTYAANENDKTWTFWITQEMQSFLGWSMIFLILVACSLGYCINWLKKKKSEKIEAWREKEERARKAEEEKEKEQLERDNRHSRYGRKGNKSKSKRKSSKVKHRAHLEKSKKSKNKYKEYSNVPIDNISDQSDGNINDDNKEEEHDNT